MTMKTFIFDLDGTLLDTAEDIKEGVNHSLELNHLPLITKEQCISYLGNGSVKLIQRAIGNNEADFDKVFNDYYVYYNANPIRYTRPFDGITDILGKLKTLGCRTIVFTNKPQSIADNIVSRFFGDLVFRTVGVGENNVTKPDVSDFIKRIEDFDPENSVYFGDSPTDIRTGHNLGIDKTVSVLWGYTKEEVLRAVVPKAFAFIDSVLQIEEFM